MPILIPVTLIEKRSKERILPTYYCFIHSEVGVKNLNLDDLQVGRGSDNKKNQSTDLQDQTGSQKQPTPSLKNESPTLTQQKDSRQLEDQQKNYTSKAQIKLSNDFKKSAGGVYHCQQKVEQTNFTFQQSTVAISKYFQLKKFAQQSKILETESNVLPKLNYFCKICLQDEHQSAKNLTVNPLGRFCFCNDYVHIHCLEEWISKRNSLKEGLHLNQCEICLQYYDFQIVSISILNLKYFLKNLKSCFCSVMLDLMLSIIFLVLSLLGVLAFVNLLIDWPSEGAYLRVMLKMPYEACMITVTTLLFLFLLLDTIFLYSLITQYMLLQKYQIKIQPHQIVKPAN